MNQTSIRTLFLITAFLVLLSSAYNLSIVGSQMSDENIYTNRVNGVVIIDITSGGASDRAGLHVGDRLVMTDGKG